MRLPHTASGPGNADRWSPLFVALHHERITGRDQPLYIGLARPRRFGLPLVLRPVGRLGWSYAFVCPFAVRTPYSRRSKKVRVAGGAKIITTAIYATFLCSVLAVSHCSQSRELDGSRARVSARFFGTTVHRPSMRCGFARHRLPPPRSELDRHVVCLACRYQIRSPSCSVVACSLPCS